MEEKLEWTQQELNDIQYLYITNKLSEDLAKAYAALPKKKNKTLNMQENNTECYTFLRMIRKRSDYIKARLSNPKTPDREDPLFINKNGFPSEEEAGYWPDTGSSIRGQFFAFSSPA